jgi:antitoxin VapB
MRTKIFQNGNSQAVRIPSALAYERTDIELDIIRVGEELRIRPAKKSLAGVLKKFSSFPTDFLAEGRAPQEQRKRKDF